MYLNQKCYLCVSLWCFSWLRGKKVKTGAQPYTKLYKNQPNPAQFHTIHSITPLIIHICSENKNTNDQMSFLSGGGYTCEEMLMGGLRLHRLCVLSLGCQRGNRKKLSISPTLGFMGP